MDFVIGGYYLIQGVARADWMDSALLPSPFWSVSRCICRSWPDSWIFTWTTDSRSQQQRQQFREVLGLDEAGFQLLQEKFDELLNRDAFGFPNVFYSLHLARDFYSEFLSHLPNVRLLSAALPEVYVDTFIEEYTPGQGIGESGVRRKLREHIPIESHSRFRGFEVLGFNYANFCSFVCNSLETGYHTRLGIAFNQNGLIDQYEEAARAAEYTNQNEVGAEPYWWLPWLISEYPAKE